MPHRSSLTFEGALKILGAQQPKTINRLSKILGGVILVSGAAAAIATLGPAAAAPLAVLAPIWGWVDQKNEAMLLLGDLKKAFSARVGEASTRERRELVSAAHTVIVVASFLEALRTHLGEERLQALKLTDEEILSLVGKQRDESESMIRHLYEADVPAPSAAHGFEENLEAVGTWLRDLSLRTEKFFTGLAAWPDDAEINDSVVTPALIRYRQHYVDLAGAAPEFWIWASLGEHAATRQRIADMAENLQHAYELQRDDLRRVEALLAFTNAPARTTTEPQLVVSRANKARLKEPIIQREQAKQLGRVVLPTVGDAFIAPAYRVARMTDKSLVSDKNWWNARPQHDDLDVWLAAHTLSPDATRMPLLLLGDPGAGKSMLMKVLAARLPASDYTVVVVPLRRVGANSPVRLQIQQALDLSTNNRADWAELADRSVETVRVVVLDGLDELLQASSNDRSWFLQDVMDFQQTEAEQERPVIVVVTSRTVVADRVDIPAGSVILKLEEFDDDRIERWLRVWARTNAVPMADGAVRELSPEVALRQPELARQPLLLLILALYSSAPGAVPLDSGISRTTLYHRIFEYFAEREVLKGGPLREADVSTAVKKKIRRLCVAALAMFNRGSQEVTEKELAADLIALEGRLAEDEDEPGKRLLGEFFFVHTAEAKERGAGTSDKDRRRSQRSYEFLHATFGEYLVAYRTLAVLAAAADRAYGGRDEYEPEDDLLFALLSHQPIAARQSVLGFFTDLFTQEEEPDKQRMIRTLNFLVRNYRRRVSSDKYNNYRPTPPDHLRRLAVYSANILLLRIAATGAAVPLHSITGELEGSDQEWAAALSLWRAGLGADGWHAMLRTLERNGDAITLSAGKRLESTAFIADYLHAGLLNDRDSQSRLRFGIAVSNEYIIADDIDPAQTLLSSLYVDILGFSTTSLLGDDFHTVEAAGDTALIIASAIERLVATRQAGRKFLRKLLNQVVRTGLLNQFDSTTLFVNVCRIPEILDTVPQLRDPDLYQDTEVALLLARCVNQRGMARTLTDDTTMHWHDLTAALGARSPDTTLLINALPENIVEMISRLVFSLRDDRFAKNASRGPRLRQWQRANANERILALDQSVAGTAD